MSSYHIHYITRTISSYYIHIHSLPFTAAHWFQKTYGMPSQFKMSMAFDTKEKRRRFLRCARVLSLRPDFKTVKDEWRGWVPSIKIFLAFFFTKSLWSSVKDLCFLPMILLATLTTRFSRCLSFTLMWPNHETILKDKMLWMSAL